MANFRQQAQVKEDLNEGRVKRAHTKRKTVAVNYCLSDSTGINIAI